jgi:hypothetical protein
MKDDRRRQDRHRNGSQRDKSGADIEQEQEMIATTATASSEPSTLPIDV